MKKFLPILLLLASCSTLQKVQTWSNSPTGVAVLSDVKVAAALFAPQYAGVIGLGINSLQTGVVPTGIQAQTELASVTGSSPTEQKVLQLATAVVASAQTAPTAAIGLQAAANTVSPPTK